MLNSLKYHAPEQAFAIGRFCLSLLSINVSSTTPLSRLLRYVLNAGYRSVSCVSSTTPLSRLLRSTESFQFLIDIYVSSTTPLSRLLRCPETPNIKEVKGNVSSTTPLSRLLRWYSQNLQCFLMLASKIREPSCFAESANAAASSISVQSRAKTETRNIQVFAIAPGSR